MYRLFFFLTTAFDAKGSTMMDFLANFDTSLLQICIDELVRASMRSVLSNSPTSASKMKHQLPALSVSLLHVSKVYSVVTYVNTGGWYTRHCYRSSSPCMLRLWIDTLYMLYLIAPNNATPGV